MSGKIARESKAVAYAVGPQAQGVLKVGQGPVRVMVLVGGKSKRIELFQAGFRQGQLIGGFGVKGLSRAAVRAKSLAWRVWLKAPLTLFSEIPNL